MNAPLGILFIGDVVAEAGMKALSTYLPLLKQRFKPDGIIINGENITNGKGLSDKEAHQLFTWGANVITTGNHIWENWKARPLLASEARVLRPHNYPAENPGRGYVSVVLGNGVLMGVIQLQGRTYMQSIDCPFKTADALLSTMQEQTPIILVDFHAEATGEKIAMGRYLDGRVSAVFGTHTHVQTADAQILPNGTAYISDVGMTGPYNSVLGMRTDVALNRFIYQTAHRYEAATDDIRIAGAFVHINPNNGHALALEPFVHPSFNKGTMTTNSAVK